MVGKRHSFFLLRTRAPSRSASSLASAGWPWPWPRTLASRGSRRATAAKWSRSRWEKNYNNARLIWEIQASLFVSRAGPSCTGSSPSTSPSRRGTGCRPRGSRTTRPPTLRWGKTGFFKKKKKHECPEKVWKGRVGRNYFSFEQSLIVHYRTWLLYNELCCHRDRFCALQMVVFSCCFRQASEFKTTGMDRSMWTCIGAVPSAVTILFYRTFKFFSTLVWQSWCRVSSRWQ